MAVSEGYIELRFQSLIIIAPREEQIQGRYSNIFT